MSVKVHVPIIEPCRRGKSILWQILRTEVLRAVAVEDLQSGDVVTIDENGHARKAVAIAAPRASGSGAMGEVKRFESRDRAGNPRTLDETFWDAIDEAQENWDKVAAARDDPPAGMSGRGWDAYCSARLTGSLSTILTLAEMMRARERGE